MIPKHSSALALMQQYVEIMAALAKAIRDGQGALVHMDLPEFERLTKEQEMLCTRLQQIRFGHPVREADENDGSRGEMTLEGTESQFVAQRVLLQQQCIALEEQVRHLNRVNHFFLTRARQSLELLLRLAVLSQATYSPRPAEVAAEYPGRRD